MKGTDEVLTFDLKTAHGNYPSASIEIGQYPKQDPFEATQTGWRVNSQHGEPIGSPTVNLWNPPVFPAEGCVFIKITPEYSGWIESLEAAKLVERTGRIEGAGFIAEYAAECRVLNPALLKA